MRAIPTPPLLNRGHPLARGLVYDLPFWQRAGSQVADSVAGVQGTLSSSYAWTNGLYGTGVSFPTATTAVCASSSVFTQYKNGPFTFMALVKVNSANSVDRMFIHDRANAANAVEVWLEMSTVATNQIIFGFYNGTTFPQAAWTSGWAAGSTHLLFGIWDRSNLLIYADGDPKLKASTVNTVAPAGAGTPTMFIGNHFDTTKPTDGNIYAARIWNRILTDKERLALWADPFVIYRQQRFPYANALAAATQAKMMALLGMG